MSAESDYFENPIQVDKGRLGKSEQGPVDIATPWRQPCILYAARLGASEGPPACNLTHDRIWLSIALTALPYLLCYKLRFYCLCSAIYENAAVVVDRNLVTSRTPSDLPDFCKAIIERLT